MKKCYNISIGWMLFGVAFTHKLFAQTQEAVDHSASWFHTLSAVVLVVSAIGLFLWYQRQRDRQIQLNNLLERDKAEKQLAALKAQINPHFLFNSFNSLIAIIETEPKMAVEYVENLSDFYRRIMQLRGKEIIPIQEELELVENYAYLLKKRYGDNFLLSISLLKVEGYIVPLTLQMLVENSVKHNVISRKKPLTIKIYLKDQTHLVVVNNLQVKPPHEMSTRFGLQSLMLRYDLLGKRKVRVEKTETEFRVSIPIIQ